MMEYARRAPQAKKIARAAGESKFLALLLLGKSEAGENFVEMRRRRSKIWYFYDVKSLKTTAAVSKILPLCTPK